MCSPAASLERLWRSGPIYICHKMTCGKWKDDQECLSVPPVRAAILPASWQSELARLPWCWLGLRVGALRDQERRMASGMRRMERGERNVKIRKKPSRTVGCSWGPLELCHFFPLHGVANRLLAPRDLVCCCDQDGDSSARRKSAKLPLRSLFFIYSLFLAASHLAWVVVAPTTAVLLVEQTSPLGLVPPEMV